MSPPLRTAVGERARALLDEAGEIDPAVLVDLAAALAWSGAPPPRDVSSLTGALRAAVAGDIGAALALPPDVRREALLVLAESVRPDDAGRLAHALVDDGTPPVSPRLPAILALTDEPAFERLLAAQAEQFGEAGSVWAAAVVEALVAAHDAGVAPPASVRIGWGEMQSGDPHGAAEVEVYAGRIRLAARRDPAGALPLLDDAIGAVGVYGAETPIEAVFGRLALVDEAAAAAFLAARSWRPDERALMLRAMLWEAPSPNAHRELATLVRSSEIAEPPVVHELLAACARFADAALALEAIDRLRPPAHTIWNATWAPVRKRGGDPEPYLAALAGASAGGGAADTDLAPAWTLLPAAWQREYVWLKSLPIGALPWWRPWNDGLP